MCKLIIENFGSSFIAAAMNESIQTVNNWKVRGIPLDKVISFCDAVKYEITPHMLYPENYPNPDDGLPNELRCNCKDAA